MEGPIKSTGWSKFKKYIGYILVATVLIIFIYSYYFYFKTKVDQKAIELQKVEQLEKEQRINDSLYVLRKRELVLDQHNKIVQEKEAFYKKADSIISNARYQPGSIVYIKPDSIRAVVDRIDFVPGQTQINYILLLDHDKENGQSSCKRADYLLF